MRSCEVYRMNYLAKPDPDYRWPGTRDFLSQGLLPTLCLDKGRVPATAVFHNTTLCGVVDVDDAEALAVAFSPLEVIQQRPNEVALHWYPLRSCLPEGLKMFMEIVKALRVTDVIAAIPLISKSSTILCHRNGTRSIVMVDSYQYIS